MKKMALAALMVALLAGCAAMRYQGETPAQMPDGTPGFFIKAAWGIDGTRDEAREILAEYAPRVCQGGYKKENERDYKPTERSVIIYHVWMITCDKDRA